MSDSDFREARRSLAEGDVANVRAGWLLEPSLVLEAVLQADARREMWGGRLTEWALRIFEPSSDGLERIVAAVEHVNPQQHDLFKRLFYTSDFDSWMTFVGRIVDPDGRPDIPDGYVESAEARLSQALGHWSDPNHAFEAAFAYFEPLVNDNVKDYYDLVEFARTTTLGWEDQAKREVFVDRFQEKLEEDDENWR